MNIDGLASNPLENNMLDYICFDALFTQGFTEFLKQSDVQYQLRDDDMGTIVSIPDDLNDELDDLIDEQFEALEREYEVRLKQEMASGEKNITAISVNLSSGDTCYVPVSEEMMQRLLSVLSPQEVGDLVDAIVSVVEKPDPRFICKHDPVMESK
jgi:hypothetical protein